MPISIVSSNTTNPQFSLCSLQLYPSERDLPPYCEMYEELYGKSIDQIVILIVTEEGATQTFVKNKKDYLPLLKPAIEEFHKKFKENGKTN